MTKFRAERRHNVEVFALFEITTKEIWQKKKAHETETKWQKLLGVKLPTCSKIGVYSSFRKVADVHYTTLFNFWKAYRTQKKWDTAEEPFGSSKVTSKFRSTVENCWRAPQGACIARNDTKKLGFRESTKIPLSSGQRYNNFRRKRKCWFYNTSFYSFISFLTQLCIVYATSVFFGGDILCCLNWWHL